MTTLQEVKAQNRDWFSPENKRFFGDVSYKIFHGKITKQPFLVRATNAWTDMFDQPKRIHYRINPINPSTLKIEMLIEEKFNDMEDVKTWLEDE